MKNTKFLLLLTCMTIGSIAAEENNTDKYSWMQQDEDAKQAKKIFCNCLNHAVKTGSEDFNNFMAIVLEKRLQEHPEELQCFKNFNENVRPMNVSHV